MEITITQGVQDAQGVVKNYMITVSWQPHEGGLEIGLRILWPAVLRRGMVPRDFAMFFDQAVLFSPPGKVMKQLQRMQDALKKHPTTSGFPVRVCWSPPELRAFLQPEET